MSLHRAVFVSWIVTGVLAASVLAAWSGGPDGGPAPTQDLEEYQLLPAFLGTTLQSGGTSVIVHAESSLVSFAIQGSQHMQLPVDFRVTVEGAHLGRNDTKQFFVQSFFDVFFDMVPSDPATGRDGFLATSVSGMLDLGDLTVGDLVIDPCFIVENSFEIEDDVANDVRTFRSRSFHHVLLGATDPAGMMVFDYGAMTEEKTTIVEARAGTSAEIDSFFDVFFDVFPDPATAGGGGMAHSFFDISYAVFEPNDEPLLQVDADGRVKAGVHLRPGQGDAIVQLQDAQSERIGVMFNPKEYTLGKSNHWNENEGLPVGSSTVPADSFYHTFFKVKRNAESPTFDPGPLHKEATLRVQLDFSPPQGGTQPPINLKANAHEVVQTGG